MRCTSYDILSFRIVASQATSVLVTPVYAIPRDAVTIASMQIASLASCRCYAMPRRSFRVHPVLASSFRGHAIHSGSMLSFTFQSLHFATVHDASHLSHPCASNAIRPLPCYSVQSLRVRPLRAFRFLAGSGYALVNTTVLAKTRRFIPVSHLLSKSVLSLPIGYVPVFTFRCGAREFGAIVCIPRRVFRFRCLPRGYNPLQPVQSDAVDPIHV